MIIAESDLNLRDSFLHELKARSMTSRILDRVKKDKLGLITVEEGVRLPGEPALDGSVEVDEAEKVSLSLDLRLVRAQADACDAVLAEVDCSSSSSIGVVAIKKGSLRRFTSTKEGFPDTLRSRTPQNILACCTSSNCEAVSRS